MRPRGGSRRDGPALGVALHDPKGLYEEPVDKGQTLERSERVLDVASLHQTPCRGSVLLIRVLLVGLGQRGAVADGRRCTGADFVGAGLS